MDEILLRLKETFDPETVETLFGPYSLYGGLLVGVLWGIVLHKSRLTKYDVVSGLFRLQDFTLFRVGTPVLMISMVGLYLLKDLGIIELHLPSTVLLAQLIGGLMFGAGIAILGYCPALAAGALGEGSLDAVPGMGGMVIGSVLYAEFFHESRLDHLIRYADLGPITWPDLFFFFNHWFYIIAFVAACTIFLIGITIYDSFLKTSFIAVGKAVDAVKELK